MPELTNSQRRLYKATYAPITPDRTEALGRGVAKGAYVSALGVRSTETTALRRRLANSSANVQAALTLIEAIAADPSPTATFSRVPDLAKIDSDALVAVGAALVEERTSVAARVADSVAKLRDAYANRARPAITPAPTVTAPAPSPAATVTTGRDVQGRPTRVARTVSARQTAAAGTAKRTLTIHAEVATDLGSPAPLHVTAATSRPSASGTIEDAIAWAKDNQADIFSDLRALTEAHAPMPMAYSVTDVGRAISHVIPKVQTSAGAAAAALQAFSQQMKVEPVGRLHLERIEMTPVGVERGELISSIPLTPKETVNISHREWSVTTEEFESIVQDYFEGFSETGVAEKTEVAEATENQTKHATALTFGASASASYLGVTLSSQFGYNSSSDDSTAQKDSRNSSINATRQASARTKKDHKTSFRTTSVAGTEDRAVRVITNPSDTMSMRVDYYQLMRKWQCDLYRYGLRMTYDIVIPSPGADLLRKIETIASLDAQIDNPFDFTLQMGQVTRDNYTQLAAQYQADGQIPDPPVDTISKMANAVVQKTKDDDDQMFVGNVDLDVDDGYELTSGTVVADYYYIDIDQDEGSLIFDVMFDSTPQVTSTLFPKYPSSALHGAILGRTGSLSVSYFSRGVRTASINVAYTATVRDDVYRAWQFKAWSAIRAAAEQQYQASRQALKDQRAALAADLSPFDALTLRRMELEEVMKGVMRWLFGPQFNVTPADITAILNKMAANDPFANDALDPSSLTNQQWQRMMQFGEFIKYVQNAIEWENVLYFTYPYFWDAPKNWTIKQFLEHPDAIHQTFLRAGAARVVLTIRPGFEESFAALIETGAFGQLPGSHPYVTIAQEIENYANTNYPGIPPANPANMPDEATVNAAERGILIARWWEYTPTSALDVQLNTSFPEMA